jgi:hypothetical protein
MAGLRIAVGGGNAVGSTSRLGQSGTSSIAQTAYGAGSSPDQAKGGLEHWHMFIGAQVAALAWLVFLRWSLPSGKSKE